MNHDDPVFDINFALRHKLSPRIKWNDESASKRAAKSIAEHLRLCGWELTKRTSRVPHGTGSFMAPVEREE